MFGFHCLHLHSRDAQECAQYTWASTLPNTLHSEFGRHSICSVTNAFHSRTRTWRCDRLIRSRTRSLFVRATEIYFTWRTLQPEPEQKRWWWWWWCIGCSCILSPVHHNINVHRVFYTRTTRHVVRQHTTVQQTNQTEWHYVTYKCKNDCSKHNQFIPCLNLLHVTAPERIVYHTETVLCGNSTQTPAHNCEPANKFRFEIEIDAFALYGQMQIIAAIMGTNWVDKLFHILLLNQHTSSTMMSPNISLWQLLQCSQSCSKDVNCGLKAIDPIDSCSQFPRFINLVY